MLGARPPVLRFKLAYKDNFEFVGNGMVGGFAGFTHDPAHHGQTDCCQIALVKNGGAGSVSFNADHPVLCAFVKADEFELFQSFANAVCRRGRNIKHERQIGQSCTPKPIYGRQHINDHLKLTRLFR